MNPTVILTVASGAEHPLIDLDYSIVIQLGIFLVTTIVATTMLFRPYVKMRDRRYAGIEGAREEAANMSAEADARLVDYENKLASARARAQDERHQIRAEAARHQSEVTTKARDEAHKATDAAREKVTAESERARQSLLPKASQIGSDIAAKLLGRDLA